MCMVISLNIHIYMYTWQSTNIYIYTMDTKIEHIEERLHIIEQKVDKILELLQKDIQPNCSRMGSHISFVETVYDNVKNPLGFICSKVNYLRSSNDQVSYNLENKDC